MQFLFTKGIPQSSAIHLKLWKALGITIPPAFNAGEILVVDFGLVSS